MVLAAEIASELTELTSTGDGGVVSYRRRGAVFARASADALEVRLPLDIAEAALETPDTTAVPGQAGWVRFTPSGQGRRVTDRATAWFHTAWRHSPGGD
jgi:hypothetical protein